MIFTYRFGDFDRTPKPLRSIITRKVSSDSTRQAEIRREVEDAASAKELGMSLPDFKRSVA